MGQTIVLENLQKRQEPKKTGRPKGATKIKLDENTIRQVETLAGYGLAIPEVAAVLGISERTLADYKEKNELFSAAWHRGKQKMKAMVAGKLIEKIQEKDLPAIKWFEQTRYGYSEKLVTENTTTHRVQRIEEYLREGEKNVTAISDSGNIDESN